MNGTRQLKGQCTECGGFFHYPAQMIGTNSRCPLCGKETELLLATPEPIESALPPRIIVWTVIAVVILGAGLAGSLVALKQARSWVENRRPPATLPTAKAVSEPGQRVLFELNGIQVTALSVEKPRGGGMAYATGQLVNRTKDQLRSVTVVLDILDTAGQKLVVTEDSTRDLMPDGTWNFRAPLLVSQAASARVTTIRKTQ